MDNLCCAGDAVEDGYIGASIYAIIATSAAAAAAVIHWINVQASVTEDAELQGVNV